MHPLVALAVLAGFPLVSSESYLATHAVGVFRMSFLGFGPTELRLLLLAGALRVHQSPWVDPFGASPAPPVRRWRRRCGGWSWPMCSSSSSALATRALYIAEPVPVRAVDTGGPHESPSARLRDRRRLGFVVQMGVLFPARVTVARAHLIATALAVETAVLPQLRLASAMDVG